MGRRIARATSREWAAADGTSHARRAVATDWGRACVPHPAGFRPNGGAHAMRERAEEIDEPFEYGYVYLTTTILVQTGYIADTLNRKHR